MPRWGLSSRGAVRVVPALDGALESLPMVHEPAEATPAEDALSPALMRFVIARSRARGLVLRYLASAESSYASEISRATGVTVSNVLGALVGRGERYSGRRSLVSLGLVRQCGRLEGQPRVFSITPAGLDLASRMAGPRAAGPDAAAAAPTQATLQMSA